MNPALLGVGLLRWVTGAVNVVLDGNSLTTFNLPARLALLPPLSTSSTTVNRIGVSGQQASQMTSNRADVTAAWNGAKTNVMVAWEITNSLQLGRTPQQAVDDLLTYCTTIKAEHAWQVAVVTAIPRYQKRAADALFTQVEVDAYNAAINDANTLLRAQWRAAADLCIDLRAPGSAYAFADYLPATFTGSGLYVGESADGGTVYVHPLLAGDIEVARLIADGLKRMPAR